MYGCAYLRGVECAWDPKKAAANLKNHSIDFADAATVLHDEMAITIVDPDHDEERFLTLGMDALGHPRRRVLVAERPTAHLGVAGQQAATSPVRGKAMKRDYDFSAGKRGAVVAPK